VETRASLPRQPGPQIELRGIGKAYAGQVVLENIDLEVRRGESVAVLGRSGSGKSTLLKLIGGLDTPDKGAVLHDGRDLGGMSDDERTRFRRQNLGFVFQFFNLIPTLTVAENIGLPLALNGYTADKAEARIASLLADLGLGAVNTRYPEELSGGEQQRVAIARAIAHAPALILADEPTGNLDHDTAAQVLALLDATCKASATTLLVATHSLDVAKIADRVLTIRSTRLEETPL
jgi:putative ABC transport system ATP-binding protein